MVREQYIQEQNGLCMYCKQPLTDQPPKEILDKEMTLMEQPVHIPRFSVEVDPDEYPVQISIMIWFKGAKSCRYENILWRVYAQGFDGLA